MHFFKSLRNALINMTTILMVSAKMATLGFLEIKVFRDKGYDVIFFFHHVSSKILSSLESNYFVDMVM